MNAHEQEEQLARWLEQHQGLLLRVVRTHEANPEDREDLFQETLVQLWRSIPAYSGKCRESTWVYRVALNTAFNWRRKAVRWRGRSDLVAAVVAASETPPTEAADIEALYDAIRRLPKPDAALVIMHLDQLSYAEIAEVLGITPNNVGVRLTRARKRLAQLLEGETP